MKGWLFTDDQARAMYVGGQANAKARRFAHVWAFVFAQGLMPKRWVTLEVVGRRSGRIVRFPLGMSDYEGQWYLVAMLGEHCNWVQNVRAANGRVVLRRRHRHLCQLVEVPASDRPAIIQRYLEKAPGARPHFAIDRHAPLADFEAMDSRYPVFRVDFNVVAPSQPAVPQGRQSASK